MTVTASRIATGLLLAALTGAGCRSDHPLAPTVGRPCADSTECEGTLVCLTDFPDGYCSEACDVSEPCDNAACVEGTCLAYCTTADDCRPGYTCVSAGGRRACAPPGRGYAGIGDNCSGTNDCASDLSCELLFEVRQQCTRECTEVLDCGVNGVCVDQRCYRTCENDTDCHVNQICVSSPDGRICQPLPPTSPLGGPCEIDDDCEGDLTCLTDAPDGYCTKSCINQAACDGGVCHEGFCYSSCTPYSGAVDILFVIDDSGGMAPFQQLLVNASGTLFNALESAGTDFRVGVVTTDVDTGDYQVTNCRNKGGALQTAVGPAPCEAPPDPWITATNVTDPAATFACIVNRLGDQGCGFEQPFEAMHRAVSSAVNPGFIRQEEDLIVVLATNEDDCSAQNQDLYDATNATYGDFVSYRCFEYGIACEGTGGSFTNCHTKPVGDGGVLYAITRFSSQLEAVKGSLDKVTVIAVAGPDTPVSAGLDGNNQMTLLSSCPGGTPDAQPGIRVAELLDAVSGHFYSICTGFVAAWDPIIQQIAPAGACRPGYRCSEEIEGNICEPR